MEAEPMAARFAAELDELEAARAADRAAERRNAWITRIVSGALVLIVGAFAFTNYRHFAAEWTKPKLEASLRRELDTLGASATNELSAMGQELAPVYADEGLRQLQELSPEIARRFVEQFEHLGTDLHAEALARLNETEERVRSRVEALACESFPELAESRQDELAKEIHRATDASVSRSLAHFDQCFSGDVGDLQQVVMSFDVSDSDEPTVELQKRFLRGWLRLLDAEVAKL